MSDLRRVTSLQLEVLPAAREQEPVVANLLELYAHDFSELRRRNLREDGRFGYEALPLYWTEQGRYPFLIRVDGSLAGLVLVKRGAGISGVEVVWDMAEFFVVRGCRRRGVGTQAGAGGVGAVSGSVGSSRDGEERCSAALLGGGCFAVYG